MLRCGGLGQNCGIYHVDNHTCSHLSIHPLYPQHDSPEPNCCPFHHTINFPISHTINLVKHVVNSGSVSLVIVVLLAQAANALLQAVTQTTAALDTSIGIASMGKFHLDILVLAATDFDWVTRVDSTRTLLLVVALAEVAAVLHFDAAVAADPVCLQSSVELESVALAFEVIWGVVLDLC